MNLTVHIFSCCYTHCWYRVERAMPEITLARWLHIFLRCIIIHAFGQAVQVVYSDVKAQGSLANAIFTVSTSRCPGPALLCISQANSKAIGTSCQNQFSFSWVTSNQRGSTWNHMTARHLSYVDKTTVTSRNQIITSTRIPHLRTSSWIISHCTMPNPMAFPERHSPGPHFHTDVTIGFAFLSSPHP